MFTHNEILSAVCAAFGIPMKDLLSKSHKRHLFYARVIAAHLLHTHLGLSSTKVGMLLCRNHATVLHYYKTFDIWIEHTWLNKEPLTYFVKVDDILNAKAV